MMDDFLRFIKTAILAFLLLVVCQQYQFTTKVKDTTTFNDFFLTKAYPGNNLRQVVYSHQNWLMGNPRVRDDPYCNERITSKVKVSMTFGDIFITKACPRKSEIIVTKMIYGKSLDQG